MKVTSSTFVCQLGKKEQQMIKERVIDHLYDVLGEKLESEFEEIIENAMCGRLCNLDTQIDISDLISS